MTQPEDRTESASLWRRVQRDLERERGLRAWLRSRRTPMRVAAVLAACVLLAGLTYVLSPRSDLAAVPTALLVLVVALFAVGVVAGILRLLRPAYRARASVKALLVWVAAGWLLPLLVVGLAPAHDAVLAHPESFEGAGDDFWRRATICFGLGVALAFPVLVLARLLDRNAELTGLRMLLLAGAAGLVGNLTLLLHCPLVAPEHLIAGHLTVPVGTLAVLLIAGRRRT